MPEFALPDRPGIDELVHTDQLLDALANREKFDADDPNEGALAMLLGDWRDDLRWPPASALVSPEEAIAAWHAGLEDRRHGRRGVATIGSVAATLLVLSGFGAVVAEARPGDTLYGLHAMFFDEPHMNQNQIELSAKAELAKVQEMIDKGEWVQAQSQLDEISSTLQSMDAGTGRNDLMDEVNLLHTKVVARDPNATLPAASPPIFVPPPVASPVMVMLARWRPRRRRARHRASITITGSRRLRSRRLSDSVS
ncbi:hypothetical protein MRAB57_513 [Mycobacterium rhizamassiliense]|uniref:Anti-sigma-D factor RsdA sigma factor binding region domain-containing protein n=1 Tax=Mycobacterium rhizamassiliense TaxID=1841860 RepID=A0A2U3NMP4_9MYCO|nr:anti-sigma-D factor RsdA [Mycobacterium rhizamassiliense]SPM32714.1 hypothetical protein MRAB57_513 [Mycobacterium rhizamassiliense]